MIKNPRHPTRCLLTKKSWTIFRNAAYLHTVNKIKISYHQLIFDKIHLKMTAMEQEKSPSQFSWEFWEIFQDNYSTEHQLTTF